MKVNFVSFSDYSSKIELYNLDKMDLFVFLLIKIIKKGSKKTVGEVLLDLDVTKALLYLYQNNFYDLLDNGLIINNSNSEDINEIVVDDLKFSEFGELCLSASKIPVLEKKEEKRVIYNPLKKQLVSENRANNSSNVVVWNNEYKFLELINKYKKELTNRYDDIVLNYSDLEADPYYFEMTIDSNNLSENISGFLKNNALRLDDNKEINEDKKEFLSSNFKVTLFYGKEKNLVNSDYYLLVNEEKKYTMQDNKIYIDDIVKEFNDYSFVEVGRETKGYNVGKVNIDGVEGSCFESFKLKDYKGDIKKYLLKNRDKYEDVRKINEIIDLL